MVVAAIAVVHGADLVTYIQWERRAPVPPTYVGAAATSMPDVIGRLVPRGEALASFDSGALGYFSPRPVINLDGLANHDILELRRSCTDRYSRCVLAYLETKGVSVLAGGTAFSWTGLFPDWSRWERLYESPPLADGSRLVLLRLPARQ